MLHITYSSLRTLCGLQINPHAGRGSTCLRSLYTRLSASRWLIMLLRSDETYVMRAAANAAAQASYCTSMHTLIRQTVTRPRACHKACATKSCRHMSLCCSKAIAQRSQVMKASLPYVACIAAPRVETKLLLGRHQPAVTPPNTYENYEAQGNAVGAVCAAFPLTRCARQSPTTLSGGCRCMDSSQHDKAEGIARALRSCRCRHLVGCLVPARSDEVHCAAQFRVDGHELDRRLGAAAAALAGDVAHRLATVVRVQAQRAAAECRQMRVVRRRTNGHRARAPAEQVAQPAWSG